MNESTALTCFGCSWTGWTTCRVALSGTTLDSCKGKGIGPFLGNFHQPPTRPHNRSETGSATSPAAAGPGTAQPKKRSLFTALRAVKLDRHRERVSLGVSPHVSSRALLGRRRGGPSVLDRRLDAANVLRHANNARGGGGSEHDGVDPRAPVPLGEEQLRKKPPRLIQYIALQYWYILR